MQVAIVSDIHANRHAFEAVLADVATTDAEEVWCLGDLVGYGADPDACVELALDRCAVVLAGNHDMAVTGAVALDDFSSTAAIAAQWTREAIAATNLEALERLEPLDGGHAVGLYHASPRDPIWEYVLSALLAELCLETQPQRVCFVGHSHVALSFSRMPGELTGGEARPGGSDVDLREGEWLLNPGSVGQPRDGDPRAAWLLLDLDAWTASYRRVDYDIAGASEAIRTAGLPDSLAQRLEYGH